MVKNTRHILGCVFLQVNSAEFSPASVKLQLVLICLLSNAAVWYFGAICGAHCEHLTHTLSHIHPLGGRRVTAACLRVLGEKFNSPF